jgi:hypothetical protein
LQYWVKPVLEGLYFKRAGFCRPFFVGVTLISIGIAWRVLLLKEHCFCKTCGIYTHHIRRSDPSLYCVNIGCFDDINVRYYLATAINDVVSMSLAADDADC